jgi:hypothetical protein
MAGKRKASKKLVTMWLEPEEIAALTKKAKDEGYESKTAFLRAVIREEPVPYGKKKD